MNYHRICQKLKTKSQHTNCVVKSLEYFTEKLKIGIGWDFAEKLTKNCFVGGFSSRRKKCKNEDFHLNIA